MLKNSLRSFAALALVGTGIAHAQVRFLATDDDQLFRADSNGNVFASVFLSDDIVGMTIVPAGVALAGTSAGDIIAVSGTQDISGRFPVYRLDNAFGAASLFQIGSTDRNVTSLAFENGNLWGITPTGGLRSIDLGTLNAGAPTLIGGPGAGFGGLQYDGSQFLALSANDESLYSYISPGPATLIGATGQVFNNMGIELFNGRLFGALDLDGSTDVAFGSFDLSTGAFTTLATGFGHRGGSTGFIAVPAPAGLALLGLGGLVATRRRR